MTTLLGRILTSRKLPSKGQLLQATANRAKSFIKNPINTLKDGLNAHKTVNITATLSIPKMSLINNSISCRILNLF